MRNDLSPITLNSQAGISSLAASRCLGFSLLELMLVVSIMSALLLIAAPHFRVSSVHAENHLRSNLASAFRYARDRALATGDFYAVAAIVEPSGVTFKVGLYETNTFVSINHPITKKPFEVFISSEFFEVGTGSNSMFVFNSNCDIGVEHIVGFDRRGIPRCLSPVTALLDSTNLAIASDSVTMSVEIAPFTGRVLEL